MLLLHNSPTLHFSTNFNSLLSTLTYQASLNTTTFSTPIVGRAIAFPSGLSPPELNPTPYGDPQRPKIQWIQRRSMSSWTSFWGLWLAMQLMGMVVIVMISTLQGLPWIWSSYFSCMFGLTKQLNVSVFFVFCQLSTWVNKVPDFKGIFRVLSSKFIF